MQQLQQYLNVSARYKIKDGNIPEILPAQADEINVFAWIGKNFMHISKINLTLPRLQATVPSECHCSWKALNPRAFQFG